jgi:hypothetical protein
LVKNTRLIAAGNEDEYPMSNRNFSRIYVVRAVLTSLFILAAYPVLGQTGNGTLHVAITDATGKVIPAIVCITSVADGTWRLPPDGTIASPHVLSNIREQGDAKRTGWSPQEPGTMHLLGHVLLPNYPRSERNDAYPTYAGLPSIPYFNEPVGYFEAEPFTITLPPGKWRLAVEHGPEYLPVFKEIALASGQSLSQTVQMVRWVDMPKQGWWSGDPEFHHRLNQPWLKNYVLTWAEAQDVHMTSDLSAGTQDDRRTVYDNGTRASHSSMMGYGKAFRYQVGDYAIATGHEGPRPSPGEQGHLIQLNISALVTEPGKNLLMDLACDKVHAQGGMCGYAHLPWTTTPAFLKEHPGSPHPGWDASINTIRGKIDFMEILQFRQDSVVDYYDFLNMGVKLTALAASDVPAGATLGESVTYAFTGPRFSPDAWYEAVKEGHTFVTNGPMLTLKVNGHIPGDQINVPKNSKVHIHVVAAAPEAIGSPKVLEVISHGRAIKSVESHDPKQGKLTADFDIPATESQWIVAKATSYNGAVAHTSPVYVIVDGKSFADRSQLPQLIAEQMKVLDFIEERLHDPRYIQRAKYSDIDVRLMLASIQDAREKYKEVLAAGGVPPTAQR